MSKLERYVEILEAIQDGFSNPTQIMYSTGLVRVSLANILLRMVQFGLITERKNKNVEKQTKQSYDVTQKGVNAITYMKKTKGYLSLPSIH